MRAADAALGNEVRAVDVALMNEKVTFQKNAVVTDAIGNHVNAWEDFYSCFATIGGEGLASSKEKCSYVKI
jgi:head-tail adaptor